MSNAARPPRVFISRTTAGLAPLAQDIATALRSRGLLVDLQTDFLPDWRSVPQMLQHRLMQCDCVLALIGPAHGAEPAPHLQPAQLRDPRTHGQPYAFTQWEYLVARDLGRPLYTFLVSGPDLITPFDPESPDLAQRQQHFITTFAKDLSTLHYEFTSRAKLLAQIQEIDFPLNVSAGRPQNLPYTTLGTLFKGRHDFLTDLHTQLTVPTSGSGTDAEGLTKTETKTQPIATVIRSRQAIHGMGGVGKTRAAVEYAWAHAETYRALLFATADSPDSLQRNLAALCGPLILNLPAQLERETEAQFNAVLHWLNQTPGWLLILDNVDTPEAQTAVRQLSVRLPHGHILITSTRNDWPRGFTRLELDVLTQPASIAFLLDHTAGRRAERPQDDPTHAATIAHHLGGHALALEQAAAYVRVKRRTLADYLTAWETERNTLLGQPLSKETTDYDRTLLITYNLSIAQLDPAAKKLLQILSWLAPDPIPTSAIANLTATIPDPQQSLEDLTHLHLARPNPESTTTTLHRLTQELTRQQQNEEKPEALVTALEWINQEMPDRTDDVRTWSIADPLRSHAASVATTSADREIAEPTVRLMNQVAVLLRSQTAYSAAEPLHVRALALAEETYKQDAPIVATCLDNLALLFLTTNRLAEAEPLIQRALEMDERIYGPEHPNFALHLNSLAQLFKDTNRLEEAESLTRRALAIDESKLGHQHVTVAKDLNNLADLLQSSNRFAEAEPLLRRALVIDEAFYGPDHPDVAVDINNLAQLLQATNRFPEAETLMQRALAIFESAYGPNHPQVALSINNLVRLLQASNRLEETEPLIRRALAIDEGCYGPNHPSLAYGLNNLAHLFKATDRLADAEPLLRRALTISESSYGENHPNVATDLNNLFTLLYRMGNFPDAEHSIRRSLSLIEGIYGPAHPDVASAVGNLAALLLATDRAAEAEPLFRRALASDESSFGPDHPKVAIRLNGLAKWFSAANKQKEAEPLMRRVLEIFLKFNQQTGHPHPHMETATQSYKKLLSQMGDSEEQTLEKIRSIMQPFGISP